MSLTFHCPGCGAPLDPPSGSDSAMRCPFCSSSVIIPQELRHQPNTPNTLSRAQVLKEMPESARDIVEIIQLVKHGQKEEAIRRAEEVFHVNPTEARSQVESIENKQMLSFSYQSPQIDTPPLQVNSTHISWNTGETHKKSMGALGKTCLVLSIALLAFGIVAFVTILAMIQPGGPLQSWWQQVNPAARSSIILSFGEEGLNPGQITDAETIAVDEQGNIFVADFKDGRIQQFDPQGNFVHLWDAGDGQMIIWALEVDQNGILYAAAEHEILRYDINTGDRLASVPNPNDYFFYDIKILTNGDIGAVVDGDTLVRMNANGETLWVVEEAMGSITGESDTRGTLTVDGDNNFYLAGTFVPSIFKYGPDGKYLNRWGSEGNEPGQFDLIYGLAITDQGKLLACDSGELEIFEMDGRFVEQMDLNDTIWDLQVGPSGNLYAVTSQDNIEIIMLK
jgi:hypothetical protein